jgi:molybdopterin-guanine dinucleotide biosynthesis protein A
MAKRAALILSGGKASRFQTPQQAWQDKALIMLEGKPLLVHAVENVQALVNEVIVCVNDETRKKGYTKILENHGLNVQIVVDQKADISGPNVAILTGLKAVQADYCLTVPCDMPFLKPEVADYLFMKAQGFDAAVPMWPNGRLETLSMVIQRSVVLEIVETLCRLKRQRVDDIFRGAAKTLLISPLKKIRILDPELKSFININSQEDLKKLPTRSIQGPVKDDLQLNRGVLPFSNLQLMRDAAHMVKDGKFLNAQKTFEACRKTFEAHNSFFWAAVAVENMGKALLEQARQAGQETTGALDLAGKEAFFMAVDCYRQEAEVYEKNRCMLLLKRALEDKAWCESQVMGKPGQPNRYQPKAS